MDVAWVLAAAAANAALAAAAWWQRSVTGAGAVVGAVLGTGVWLGAGPRAFTVLVAFFAAGTALTRAGFARKERLGAAEERGGRRGPASALAKVGPACVCGFLYQATGQPIWVTGVVASFAAALADTAATELGPLLPTRVWSTMTFRPVEPGTRGAVSLGGTLAGFTAAAALTALAAALALVPPGALLLISLAAALASAAESVAGARLTRVPGAVLNLGVTALGAALGMLFAGA